MKGGSCSCPGALGPPRYCSETGVSLRPQDRDESLGKHRNLAPSPGLPEEAGGLEEEGGHRGTGVGMNVHKWNNLVEQRDWLLVVKVFWVWAFS